MVADDSIEEMRAMIEILNSINKIRIFYRVWSLFK